MIHLTMLHTVTSTIIPVYTCTCSGGMSYNTNVLFVHVYVTIKLDLNTRHMLVIVTSVVPSSTALSSPSTSTHH